MKFETFGEALQEAHKRGLYWQADDPPSPEGEYRVVSTRKVSSPATRRPAGEVFHARVRGRGNGEIPRNKFRDVYFMNVQNPPREGICTRQELHQFLGGLEAVRS